MVVMQALSLYGVADGPTAPPSGVVRLLMMGRNWIMGAGGNPFLYWWLYLPVRQR
jgi:hypothetical protein